MKLHLSRSTDTNQITGYGPDHVLVNGVRHETSLIVLPDEVVATWVAHFEALSPQDFDVVLMRAPEIVLLGSGARLRFPSPALYAGLLKARIGVEVMDTAAAVKAADVIFVATPDTVLPASRHGAKLFVPQVADIIAAVRSVLDK